MVGLLGRLPPALGRWLGRRLGDAAHALLRDRRRTALANLAIAFPDRSLAERRRICRGSFRHLGVMLTELAMLLARPDRIEPRVRIDDPRRLEAAMKTAGRLLVLTAHLGNWELLSLTSRLTGFPASIVVRPLDAPVLDRIVGRLRRATGVEIIDKRDAVRPVLRALRGGQMVAILLDQNATRRESVFVPFFGRLTSTSRSIALLALRTGTPIVPLFIRREPGGQHRITCHAAIEPPTHLSGDDAVLELTARCTRAIESAIRQTPDQWLWMHERWRTRPAGEQG